MAQVVLAPQALADLEVISDYIVDKSGPIDAERFIGRMIATIRNLAGIPNASGHPVPALGTGLRCHAFGRYNIYLKYDEASDVLNVVRVLHGRRRITRHRFRRP